MKDTVHGGVYGSMGARAANIRAARRFGWRGIVAASSAGAGAIHVAAAGSHVEMSPAIGAFLFTVGVGQLGWAVAVTRPHERRLLVVGAVANGCVIAVWALSRTAGVPVGPEPWVAEHVHANDLLATGLEVLVLIGVVLLGRRHFAPGPMLVGVVLTLVASATVVAEHDPVRERLTAAGAVILASVVRALLPRAIEGFRTFDEGRNHAAPTIADRLRGAGVAVRAAGGPGR